MMPLRASRTAAALALILVAGGCATAAPPATEAEARAGVRPLAFANANVIPMDSERVLANHTVLIRDGRIAALGPAGSVRIPSDAYVIDVSGRYLIPGLAEMHAHIPPPTAGAAVDRTLYLYLAGGVTTIRGMLGHPGHLELRERAREQGALSPGIFTSGPSFNGQSAPTAEVATRMVAEQAAAGYDLLKLHPGLTRPVFDAIVAAASQHRIPFAGHVSFDVGLMRTLEARQPTIDHLDGYLEAMVRPGHAFGPGDVGFFGFDLMPHLDEARMPALVAATRAAGVWNVPTQSLLVSLASWAPVETMVAWPEMRYMPPATVNQWTQAIRNFRQSASYTPEAGQRFIDLRKRLIRTLHAEGAGLLLGSDAPQIMNVPGFAIWRELEYLVDAGLTPYQALETGTRTPAVYMGMADQWGTIAVGRSADLILLEANPLADINNIRRQAGVVVRGRFLPHTEIERRLEEIAAEVRG